MLDLQRYDLDATLKELDDKTQLAVFKYLNDAMASHYDYFKTGYEYFEQCHKKMIRLSEATAQLQKISDSSLSHRRNIRRQLEKVFFKFIYLS